jgi:hypothetical protein
MISGSSLIPSVHAEVLERNTVYVIEDLHSNPFPLAAFDVSGNRLSEANVTKVSTTRYSPVGLGVSTKHKLLFVSYEGYDTVEVIDGETLTKLGELQIPGTSDIAGVVVSENRNRAYTVDRYRNHVFVYAVTTDSNVTRIENEEFNTTVGLVGIDVWNNRLYATHASNVISVYDLDTRTKIADYNLTDGSKMAIAVDGSDPDNVLVYTTSTSQRSVTSSSPPSSVLTQYNINTGVEKRIDMLRDGRGVSVNPALGLMYAACGDNSDPVPPVIRTYGKNQFVDVNQTYTAVIPFDEDNLTFDDGTYGSPTDIYAAGISFNPDAYIEITDPADDNITTGINITFEITIKNPSADRNMTLDGMENLYDTDYLSYRSTSIVPEDGIDDGNISWSGLGITIAPDGNMTFTITFRAMQEVNATLDTIVVTDAESNTGEGTTAIEPYHYTIYFDIGPSSGCSPIIKTRGSGPAVGKIGAVLFALFVLLLGGFVMRRRETGA